MKEMYKGFEVNRLVIALDNKLTEAVPDVQAIIDITEGVLVTGVWKHDLGKSFRTFKDFVINRPLNCTYGQYMHLIDDDDALQILVSKANGEGSGKHGDSDRNNDGTFSKQPEGVNHPFRLTEKTKKQKHLLQLANQYPELAEMVETGMMSAANALSQSGIRKYRFSISGTSAKSAASSILKNCNVEFINELKSLL